MILMIYTATVFPFLTCFLDEVSNFNFGLDLFIDSCFLTDIVLNFFTVFQKNDGKFETDKSKIAVNYLKSWFWIDSFTTIPWQLIEKLQNTSEASEEVKILRIVRI